MTGEYQNGMRCGEFEVLLADALDGLLTGSDRERFEAHAQSCAACAASFREAEAGMRALAELAEIEPPKNLVRNILTVTSGREPVHEKAARTWGERLAGWGIPTRVRGALVPIYATVRQPRFAMSFGMVFFSFAIMLNIFGIKISDVKRVDLRPSAMRIELSNAYYQTSARIVRYYDNMRFVLEMRSRLRELQGGSETPRRPESQTPEQKKPGNNNTSGQPKLPTNLSDVRGTTSTGQPGA